MVSLAPVFFLLTFVFAAAFPVPRKPRHELGSAGQTSSRGYEVKNVAIMSPSVARGAFAHGSDHVPDRAVAMRDYPSVGTAGEGEEHHTGSRTSDSLVKKAVGLLWLSIALFALGVGAALYAARSRVLASKEMLEMLPRAKKAGSRTSDESLETEGDDTPKPSLVSPREEAATSSAASDMDLIILSEGEEDATEDLIRFEGDEEQAELSIDELPPGQTPVASEIMNDADHAKSFIDEQPESMESDLGIVAPFEQVAVADSLVQQTSPNPWSTVSSESIEASALLLVPVEAMQETPFVTPMSSPAASPRQALMNLDSESYVKGRHWTPIDLAIVMQLRPGLGAGAELAWMVKLLMSVWAWISVLLIR